MRLALRMDRRGFEATVARHQRRIFTLARYLLSDQEEAEDVAQEVLIRLWRHGDEVSPERLQSWLLRVTRNACYDRLRRHQAASRVFDPAGGVEAGDGLASPSPSPEDVAGAAILRRHIENALSALREPAKTVVILREVEGLSYAEIAEVLELPLTTVRVALHRARRRLRDRLREVHGHVATG